MEHVSRALYRVETDLLATSESYTDHEQGLWGELTRQSMLQVLAAMHEHTDLDDRSIFFDCGSGALRPQIVCALHYPVRLALGVEVGARRFLAGARLLRAMMERFPERQEQLCRVQMQQRNALELLSFEPATHYYSFDLTWTLHTLLWPVIRKVLQSRTVRCIVSFGLTPRRVRHLGSDAGGLCAEDRALAGSLVLLDAVSARMSKSGESHMAYVYGVHRAPGSCRTARRPLPIAPAWCPGAYLEHLRELECAAFPLSRSARSAAAAAAAAARRDAHEEDEEEENVLLEDRRRGQFFSPEIIEVDP